jgi:hypothetical protein
MSLENLTVGPPVELTFVVTGDAVELGPGVPGPPGPPGPAGGYAVGTAASTLSGHRVVTASPDGTWRYASNDNLADLTAPLWVTTGAVDAGEQGEAVILGPITEPSWSWTPGPVYLGVDGMLTQVPPTAPAAVFLAQVGFATSATTLFVARNPSIKLS